MSALSSSTSFMEPSFSMMSTAKRAQSWRIFALCFSCLMGGGALYMFGCWASDLQALHHYNKLQINVLGGALFLGGCAPLYPLGLVSDSRVQLRITTLSTVVGAAGFLADVVSNGRLPFLIVLLASCTMGFGVMGLFTVLLGVLQKWAPPAGSEGSDTWYALRTTGAQIGYALGNIAFAAMYALLENTYTREDGVKERLLVAFIVQLVTFVVAAWLVLALWRDPTPEELLSLYGAAASPTTGTYLPPREASNVGSNRLGERLLDVDDEGPSEVYEGENVAASAKANAAADDDDESSPAISNTLCGVASRLLRQLDFLLLIGMFLICFGTTTAMLVNAPQMMDAAGGPSHSAPLIILFGTAQLCARLACVAWVRGGRSVAPLLLLGMLLQAGITLASAIAVSVGQTYVSLFIAGWSYGCYWSLFVVALSTLFPAENKAALLGLAFVLAPGLGPESASILYGMVYDAHAETDPDSGFQTCTGTHCFRLALAAATGANLLAAVILTTRFWKRLARKEGDAPAAIEH